MIFKRINRSSPEQIFITVRNGSDTTALAAGGACVWDLTAGGADGIKVTHIQATVTTKRTMTFAGIAVEAIAVGEYGLIQVWGYHSGVSIELSETNVAYTGQPVYARDVGTMLSVSDQASGFTGTTWVMELWPGGFLMEAYSTSSGTATLAIFIKAL
jgi:hypothetical protein